MMAGADRLLWFSPFGPDSDIGAFSRPIVHALERGLSAPFREFELVIEQNGATYRPPVPFSWIDDARSLDDALCVFNIGNNSANHRRIGQLAMEVPGLVVMHDVVMHGFMVSHHLQQNRDRVGYAADVAVDGGPGMYRALIEDFLSGPERMQARAWEREPLRSLPMLAPFLAPARGVIVHSRFAAEVARRYTKAPIRQLFLTADQKRIYSDRDCEKWQVRTRSAERVMVTSFGHLTRNKRMELICEAFARSPALQERAQLRIVGYPRDRIYAEELATLIRERDLQDHVELALSVDERRLARFKDDSDVFVALRHPNTEGASGSLVEAMNTGRPTIVMRSGAFAEIPANACLDIPVDDDGAGLATALEHLVADPERRIAIGSAGAAFQRGRSAERYAAELLDFARDIVAAPRPVAGGSHHGALARLVDSQPPELVAELVCCSYLRRRPGSPLESAVRQALMQCEPSQRFLLTRAVSALLDHFYAGKPLSLSRRSLMALAQVVLQFGPTAFVDLFWPQLATADAGLTQASAVLGFKRHGPPVWPGELGSGAPAVALEPLFLAAGSRIETTSAAPWTGQDLASWHRPESNGTWTHGRYVVLPVATPQGWRKDDGWRLSVAMNNFAGKPPVEMIASVEGNAMPIRLRQDDKLRVAEIPLIVEPDDAGWLVVLDVGGAARPSDTRSSTDARLLGVKVGWVGLDVAPSGRDPAAGMVG